MKRNEILGEHKKGVVAVKYNKKPKNPADEHAKAKDKLKAVKPMEGYNPNSASAEHRRSLDQSHAADLKARAEGPDATERDQQRYQNYLDKKEQMANDYNDRMERESVAEGAMKDVSMDLRTMRDDEFHAQYKMTKAEMRAKLKEKDESVSEMRDSRDSYQRDYDFSQSGFGDQGKREFKRRELEHELGHETNNYAVAIDGRTWKVFASKSHAQAIARSLQNKGKKATVHETGAEPTTEATGAMVGKVAGVKPGPTGQAQVTIQRPDGSTEEKPVSALTPTAGGKLQIDAPDTDEIKTGTEIISKEDFGAPTTDSSSPINGDEENVDLRRLRELAGQLPAPVAAPADEVDPGEQILDVAATPEVKAFIDANTVRDTEGDVDLAGTFGQMLTKTSSEMNIKGLQDALVEMEANIKAFPSTPEFQAMSPEDQANWKQNAPEWTKVAHELVAGFVKLQQTFAAGGKQATDLSQNPTPGQENPMKGVKSFTAPQVEEAEELDERVSPIESHPEYKEAESSFGMSRGMMKAVKMMNPTFGPWGGKLTAVNAAGETVGVWDKGAWNGKNSQLMYDAQQAADAKQAERDASPEAQADRDAANTPFVPKDYQTKEPLTKGPDGKWRNSKGEERDNLHGGPISATGSAMFRSLTPRPPTQESAELTAMLRIAGLR